MKNMKKFAESMKSIMSNAWYYVKSFGWSMSEALKHAWLIFKMGKQMAQRVVEFTFKKVDGSIRQAWGTLNSSVVPQVAAGSGRKPNKGIFTYWDTEKQGWRCFKVANLMNVVL